MAGVGFKHGKGRWLRRAAVLALGGSAFQLSGCDPQVRGALLTGLQTTTTSLVTAIVSAFFLSLEDGNTTGTQTGNSTTQGSVP